MGLWSDKLAFVDAQIPEPQAAVGPIDVAVVGAGVAGLAAALAAVADGLAVVVVEARDRVGGRLLSAPVAGGGSVDLGATWFWPGERRVAALVDELGVRTHDQYLDGDAMFETTDGATRIAGNPIDVPSHRFTDGADALPLAIANTLPTGTVRLDAEVTTVDLTHDVAVVATGDTNVRARAVVVAIPPALALERIEFAPTLPESFTSVARSTPVWMGAITKVVAVYDRPFWRDVGLSGSAVSHVGPMREVHDMSGPNGRPAALFGFVPSGEIPDRFTVVRQFAALFGDDAANPVDVHIRPWCDEPFTSPTAVERLTAYQMFGHPALRTPMFDGRLAFASTETGAASPGHIEGALEAAERALDATRRPAPADLEGLSR